MQRETKAEAATSIPVTEARRQLADLVSRVEYKGETITLTRHGRPAALLVPPDALQSDRPKRSTPRASRR